MKYIVIGLGLYGTNLAIDLTDYGAEVIGVDKDSNAVGKLKDVVATSYILDSTDEDALKMLPLNKVDGVIVAIGNDFGSSVKTAALLKKIRVPFLIVRALDELHKEILAGLHVDKILTPEIDAASAFVRDSCFGVGSSVMTIDSQRSLLRFKAPRFLQGVEYSQLNLETHYGLQLLAASYPKKVKNPIGFDTAQFEPVNLNSATVGENDYLVVFGETAAVRDFMKKITVQ